MQDYVFSTVLCIYALIIIGSGAQVYENTGCPRFFDTECLFPFIGAFVVGIMAHIASVMIHYDKPIGYPLAMITCSLVAGATAGPAMLEQNSRGKLLFMLSLASFAYYGVSWKRCGPAIVMPERPLLRPSPLVFCAVCFKPIAEAILQMSEKSIEEINKIFREVSPEHHCLAPAGPVHRSYAELFDDLAAWVGAHVPR